MGGGLGSSQLSAISYQLGLRTTWARTPCFDFAQDPGGRATLTWFEAMRSRGAALRRAGEGTRPYVFCAAT